MSFDPFEARLHFLQLLRRLNASQQSIQAVVSYAVKYGRKCGEDLWECVMEESVKGSLNARINIFYMLDTLCDPITSASSLPPPTVASTVMSTSSAPTDLPYATFLERDLETLVGLVVPEGKEGMLNLLSAKQVIQSLKQKHAIHTDVCDKVLDALEDRRTRPTSTSIPAAPAATGRKRPAPVSTEFSRSDTLKRMEEDRERHKRLREKMWVIPLPLGAVRGSIIGVHPVGASQTTPSPATPASPSVASKNSQDSNAPVAGTRILFQEAAAGAIEDEFERLWDLVEDLDEEDLAELRITDTRCKEQKGQTI
ncbi:hypothetical protein QFC21_000774 [Naganishia friedmannii]|uniref:Uncharacterized protein n=1 Tax=Naganishia friedmannii TaxID=89922 RepID=A0ACC2W7Y4_9TREE|nr:hypothetical protein QFC21_000774 [Naganishia friedmannii]